MHSIARCVAAALATASVMSFTLASSTSRASAKDAQAEQSQQAEQVKPIALTDKQIEGVLATKPDADAIIAKLPEDVEELDAKTMAQLDAAAKKHGFADYAEYETVTGNIAAVMDGFDPQAKQYVGQDVMLKKQVAEVQADKSLSAKDKKEEIEQLNEALKSPAPTPSAGNIQVVTKYYDKLAALMSQGEQ